MARRAWFVWWFVLLHCVTTFLLLCVVTLGNGGEAGRPDPLAEALLYVFGFPWFIPGAWIIAAASERFGTTAPDTLLYGMIPLNSIFWGFILKGVLGRAFGPKVSSSDE